MTNHAAHTVHDNARQPAGDPWAELLARDFGLEALDSLLADTAVEDEQEAEKPAAMWEITSEEDFLKLQELLAYIRSL